MAFTHGFVDPVMVDGRESDESDSIFSGTTPS